MTKIQLSLLLLFMLFALSFAKNVTISGYVQDLKSGERISSAYIYEPSLNIGTITNNYGFFSLSFQTENDSIVIAASFIGYKPFSKKLSIENKIWLLIDLVNEILQGETVEVIGERVGKIEEKSQMSQISLPVKQIETMPAFLGETDVLKTIQLLPGIQSGSEGSSGLYVRGGSPDQNLILLDGSPVYNANHLFGFFSVFNTDAIKDVKIMKGAIPAHFGGRLSSVLEINMKEGNNKKFTGRITIGAVASKFVLEGPIIKDKTSFILSARRTYVDILARPFMKGNNFGYYFYDINGKINHAFSMKDKLFLSVYTGSDKLSSIEEYKYGHQSEKNEFGLGWGNITSTLRWNHLFFAKLFANTNITYSNFVFYNKIINTLKKDNKIKSSNNINYNSGIRDFSGSMDFDFVPNPLHYVKFGGKVIYHSFNPGVAQFNKNEENIDEINQSIAPVKVHKNSEASLYIEDDFRVTSSLKVNFGIHSSLFISENKKFYAVDPRISMRYLLWGLAFKLSYNRMTQYIHLLTNSGVGLPTDLWVPSTKKIIPERGQQAAFGIAKTVNYHNNLFELSVECYYKTMNNIIEYKEGSDFVGLNSNWQDKVEIGGGRSYGFELFVQKKTGNTTGWLGYTVSWTDRQFDGLNFGRSFPYRYNRPHDFSLAIIHSFPKSKIDISLNWVYGTGNYITIGMAKYRSISSQADLFHENNEGLERTYYGSRNSFRMGPYHRLDLSAAIKWGKTNNHRLSIGLYNVYSRKNPFFYYFGTRTDRNGEEKTVLKQVSLFPILPAINYSYKF